MRGHSSPLSLFWRSFIFIVSAFYMRLYIGNLYKARWVNSLIGHVASIFCFTPYFPWKHMHQRHHTWAGSLNKDPTMRILEKMKESQKIPSLYGVAWYIWLPLPAAAQHFLFWFYPLRVRKEGTNDRHFFHRSLFSSLFLIVVYAAFHTNVS